MDVPTLFQLAKNVNIWQVWTHLKMEVIMLWEKVHARVAVTLILCIALLMSGGVSQVVGKTLLVALGFLTWRLGTFNPDAVEVALRSA